MLKQVKDMPIPAASSKRWGCEQGRSKGRLQIEPTWKYCNNES